MEKVKKVEEYIKENKLYYISFLLGFLILFILMNQVVMYADDFLLQLKSEMPLTEIIKELFHHYFTWGGGHTPLIVTLVFQFGFTGWKIFNSFIITLMFYLGSKSLTKNKKQFLFSFCIMWTLFYLISIYIVRESVYWLDGSMAYVFSTFELFMFIYMIYTRFIKNINKKYDIILLPIVGFFSGWSDAQVSAVTLVITLLFILWYLLFKKRKVNKKFFLFVIMSLIGSSLFLLSPGNGARMEAFVEFNNLGIIQRILYRVGDISNVMFNYKYYGIMTLPFFVLLFSIAVLFLSFFEIKKCKKPKIKTLLTVCTSIESIFILASLATRFVPENTYLYDILNFSNLYSMHLENTLSFVHFIPYIFLILFIIADLVIIVEFSKSEKNPFLLMLFLAIYGTQYSMILAPVNPHRTSITTIVLLIVGIIYLLNYLNENNEDLSNVGSLIMIYINATVGFILFVLINSISDKEKFKKVVLITSILPFVYLAILNYETIYEKYYANKIIYNENVEILQSYDGQSKEIYLKKLEDETYAFASLAGSDWIEEDVKKYFNIPQDVKLIIMEEEN